jgi:hypothetical protein
LAVVDRTGDAARGGERVVGGGPGRVGRQIGGSLPARPLVRVHEPQKTAWYQPEQFFPDLIHNTPNPRKIGGLRKIPTDLA